MCDKTLAQPKATLRYIRAAQLDRHMPMNFLCVIMTIIFLLVLLIKPAMALDSAQYRAVQGILGLWTTDTIELTSQYNCLLEAWHADPEKAAKLPHLKANKQEYYEFKALIEASLKDEITYEDLLTAAENYRKNVEAIYNILGPFSSVHETVCFTGIDWFSKYVLERLNKERGLEDDSSI